MGDEKSPSIAQSCLAAGRHPTQARPDKKNDEPFLTRRSSLVTRRSP
jgi:hypothetical protein